MAWAIKQSRMHQCILECIYMYVFCTYIYVFYVHSYILRTQTAVTLAATLAANKSSMVSFSMSISSSRIVSQIVDATLRSLTLIQCNCFILFEGSIFFLGRSPGIAAPGSGIPGGGGGPPPGGGGGGGGPPIAASCVRCFLRTCVAVCCSETVFSTAWISIRFEPSALWTLLNRMTLAYSRNTLWLGVFLVLRLRDNIDRQT